MGETKLVNSVDDVVMLQREHAVALVSSAQWMRHVIRNGELGSDEDQQRVALSQLKQAIDATSAQLERRAGREPQPSSDTSWRGFLVAAAATLAATMVIKVCCTLGSPRTVDALYIPVVLGIALLVGRWPALLGCVMAFVLNDVLFVHPGHLSPGPEQIAAFAVVVVSCLTLGWLKHVQPAMRQLGIVVALLPRSH
jgi:K+-sensing histidine kinase KdpD